MTADPRRDENPPPCVLAIAAGRPVRLVWDNEAGGLTFAIGNDCFVKWRPVDRPADLRPERLRLLWAGRFTRVPVVLDHGADAQGSWMVTRALAGESAVSRRWKGDPAAAVTAIGAGLRAFHDALPVAACPFSWSIELRLEAIRARAAAGELLSDRCHPSHRPLDVDRALAYLSRPPPIDRLVVCHGDTCAPNTLIGDDGRCTGHVDLGALGIADRWADLARADALLPAPLGPGALSPGGA